MTGLDFIVTVAWCDLFVTKVLLSFEFITALMVGLSFVYMGLLVLVEVVAAGAWEV